MISREQYRDSPTESEPTPSEQKRWTADIERAKVEAQQLTEELNSVIVKLRMIAIQAEKITQGYDTLAEGLRPLSGTEKESET